MTLVFKNIATGVRIRNQAQQFAQAFQASGDSPIIINLNKFDKSLETVIQLISKNIEDNLFNKVNVI